MFGLGPSELIVILFIALLIFGPSKLPELGRSLGKAIREFKKVTSEVESEIKQGMNEIESVKKTISEVETTKKMVK